MRTAFHRGEQPEEVVPGPVCVGKVLMDAEDGVLIVEPIEHIGRLALDQTLMNKMLK